LAELKQMDKQPANIVHCKSANQSSLSDNRLYEIDELLGGTARRHAKFENDF